MSDVLIVGASGILAPAAAAVRAGGLEVTGIGRRRSMPEGVEALHLDARDADAMTAALAGRCWATALVYRPAVSDASLRAVAAAVDGRVVVVRTSGDADPALADRMLDHVDVPSDTVLLGWTGEPGAVRWHSPAEVSEAALSVLDHGGGRMLGRVRPWEERP